MQDFEKLGAFYLGRQVDPASGQLESDLVLYDSKDLTTHAVIIGMTGSGKTGLGVGLIEEAVLDHVPVVAIDPKGDLGNLLLAFPKLRGSDFEPWIDPRAAADAGVTAAEHAEATAKLWRNGLKAWGQTPDRIAKFVGSAEPCLFTPGSTAGTPLSVLASLEPPPAETIGDDELYRELVDATSSSLLALVGIEANPLTSREHILAAMVLDGAWRKGLALSLAELISALQMPPFDRIGVLDLETFYPAKDRFGLAMRFNNLLAAPRFQSWLEGDPLDIDKLLHGPGGRPRISIVSIAHLDDAERMFVVTMVLNRLVAWMRQQSGTSSLRAILYMDEVFGFMPPVANPPSKRLLLTLMKQARAYGLGVVLATQNPVDLDYKGLANAGTWFLGRLQTERDKQRVIDGLRSAAGGAALEGVDLDGILSGLGKRRFLLHNVHESAPLLFETRWVMSYLAGPMTREQIRRITASHVPESAPAEETQREPMPDSTKERLAASPVLAPTIEQRFLPASPGGDPVVYWPRLFGAGELGYWNARLGIDEARPFAVAVEADESSADIDWSLLETIDVAVPELAIEPAAGSTFAELPAPLAKPAHYRSWQAQLKRALREQFPIVIYRSRTLKMTSAVDEVERDFRIRLQDASRAERDGKTAQLKQKYAAKAAQLEERLRRARQAVEREQEQAKGQGLDAAVSFGTAVLGALLGRKAVSVTSASRVGSAVRKAGRIRKEAGDVARARETVEAVQEEIQVLEAKLQADIDGLHDAYDAQLDELETIEVKPTATKIHVDVIGVGWIPYRSDAQGRSHRV